MNFATIPKSDIIAMIRQASHYENELKAIEQKIRDAKIFTLGWIFKKKVNIWEFIKESHKHYPPNLFKSCGYDIAHKHGIINERELTIIGMMEHRSELRKRIGAILDCTKTHEDIRITEKTAIELQSMVHCLAELSKNQPEKDSSCSQLIVY